MQDSRCCMIFFLCLKAVMMHQCSFLGPSFQHPRNMIASYSSCVLHTSASPKCAEESISISDRRMLLRQSENRMLPRQSYSGVLNYEDYRHWLRFPLDYNTSFSNITSTERYFTSINTTKQGGEDQTLPCLI